ncbi:MAG TPA: shikimate kinase [Gammaproteobacteria bacterium]|nr:shikimate kinase [Gammaproteobacteria bacterium]
MAAGKSSIGRFLAKKTHKKFYDSDDEIEKKTGVNVRWIFDLEGEAGFRLRETAMIAELVKHSNIVLATGGGAIVEAENRKLLTKNGIVIYLKVSVESQLKRLEQDEKRPLLDVPDRHDVLTNLLVEREVLYRKIANFTVETDNRSIASVAEEILNALR